MYFKLVRYISLNIIKFLLIIITGQVTVIHTNMHYEVTHTQDPNYVTVHTSSADVNCKHRPSTLNAIMPPK